MFHLPINGQVKGLPEGELAGLCNRDSPGTIKLSQPASAEACLANRRPNSPGDVGPAFAPIETRAAKRVAALHHRVGEPDSKLTRKMIIAGPYPAKFLVARPDSDCLQLRPIGFATVGCDGHYALQHMCDGRGCDAMVTVPSLFLHCQEASIRESRQVADAHLKTGSGVSAMETILRLTAMPHFFITGGARRIFPAGAIVLLKPFGTVSLMAALDSVTRQSAAPASTA